MSKDTKGGGAVLRMTCDTCQHWVRKDTLQWMGYCEPKGKATSCATKCDNKWEAKEDE